MSAPRPGVGLALAAAVGALWSVVPFGVWWGDADGAAVAGAWGTWAWGGGVVLGLTVALMILSRGRAPAWLLVAWRASVGRWPGPVMLALAGAALVAFAGLILALLFAGNPRSVDGFAQLFHARMLLAGHPWVEPPAELANFATLHMVLGPDRWYSQYPPGQPAVLAVGLAAGSWWLLQPLFGVLLLAATWRVARWAADETTARLSAVFLVLSPFVVTVTATELSHVPAAALGLAAAAAATMLERGDRRRWAVAAGAALGLMVAFRPLDAVAAAVPVGLITLFTARRRIQALVLTAVGGTIATLPTLWFNAATTGSWREFGYARLWGRGIALGFHEVPWSKALTPLRAVGLTASDLHQLNMYLLDFPVPVLLLGAAGFLAGWRRLTSRDVVPMAAAGGLVGLMFFYFHRDIFFGPRQLFSVTPWFLVMLARATVLLRHTGPSTRGGVPAGMVVVTGMAVALAFGLATITPSRLAAYRSSSAMLNHHPDRDAAGLDGAVVLIPDGWGSRLIARMWEAGVPVPRSTGLYAAIDACTLELALDAADDSLARSMLPATLESLAAAGRPGERLHRTDDAALRLLPGPLPPACEAEIAFDQRGFLAFAPYLYLNTPFLDGPVVWARDLRDRNDALRRRYPDRRFFRYAPTADGGAPQLIPLTDAARPAGP
jgi:hypothetical protein